MLNAEQITQLFVLFSKNDKELIHQLKKHSCSTIENNQWQFSLPDLYEFSLKYIQPKEIPSYPKFRSLLFNSTINQDLAKLGLSINILDNQRHVDKSIYYLKKI